MDNINYTKLWRVINTILIVLGMSTPWFRLYFDTLNSPSSIGWRVVFSNFQVIGNHLSKYGFEILMLPFWLTGLSGISVIVYFIVNLFSIIMNRVHKNNRLILVVLVGIIFSFSFYVFIGGKPLLGYWLTSAGLLSGAVLEWGIIQNFRDFDSYRDDDSR